MTPGTVAERAQQIADVRARGAGDREAIRSAMVCVREIAAWAEAQHAALVGLLSAVDSFPEATIAEVSKQSLSDASKAKERAETLGAAPSIAAALEDGVITAGHVDAVTRASGRLDPDQRAHFVDRAESLVAVAVAGSVDEFAQRLNREVRQLQSDDGEARLTRQRRNVRLNTWTDGDGMWNVRGRFDPLSGLRLSQQLDTAVQTLFAEQTPELCPSNPIEKNKFLAAHALARLLGSAGSPADDNSPVRIGRQSTRGRARAEFVAVIDADAPGPCGCGASSSHTTVDWPIPVELPPRVLAELAADADVVGVVVRNGVVLHAPGEMNLGRSTRLASRDQRRALRGLYRGCAVPGCSVGFDRCKIHHVIWWRHGGLTDLANLLPVCSKHHSKLHADGWLVELGPNRELSITLPAGQVMSTGPPRRHAA